MIFLYVALFIVFLTLLTSYICFRMTFYATRKNKTVKEFDLPPGKEYIPYHDVMKKWQTEVKKMPYKDVYITSFDGLKLHGKFYEYESDAPIELMFHGYRGSAERDLCGGVQRCFSLGRSVLIVDQRAGGKSDGHIISFGINESRDCLTWVDYIINNIDKNAKIILCGISMGAATVLLAAGNPLPQNVVGVLADCGYTTAREMIEKTIKEMQLPPKILYPFVRLGGLIFGGFDINKATPSEAVKNCKVPVIFFHGESDNFVPCDMSRRCFDACSAPKALITVKGADHGLSYVVDEAGYLKTVADFFNINGVETKVQSSQMI